MTLSNRSLEQLADKINKWGDGVPISNHYVTVKKMRSQSKA